MPTADALTSSEELTKNKTQSDQSKPVKPKRTPLDYILKTLFIIGAYSSASQGFFAIESFVNSLAAIPGMAFLHLIPYGFILSAAIINFIYSVRVEQKVFEPHFYNLIKQLVGLDNKKTNNQKCIDTIQDNQKLKKQLLKLGRNQSKPAEQKIQDFINSLNNLKLKPKNKVRTVRILSSCYTFFGYLIASCVVGLRSIVSIGSTMLGMKVLALIILSGFGITTLPFPVILIPVFAITSAIGYFIKTSQNLIDQFNKILKFFGIARFIKTDLKLAEQDKVLILKNIYRAYKGTDIKSKKADLKQNKNIPHWQKVILAIFSIGFYAGAIGASMQGFFTIDKFVNQMSEVLSLFRHIPYKAILSSATIISIYILFVEQNILKQYFDSMVTKIIDFFKGNKQKDSNSNNLVKKEFCVYLSKKEYRNNYILQNLLSTDYKALAIKQGNDNKDYLVKIEFKNEASYKIFKLHQKIDQIYNEDCMIAANNKRSQNNIYNIESKIETNNPSFIRYTASVIATTVILLLRAVTSIGPSVLGLTKATNFFIAPIFRLTSFGSIVYLPSIIQASFGYFIKCSQNLSNHIATCMREMCFIETEKTAEKIKEKLLLDLRNEHKQALEIFCSNVGSTKPQEPEQTDSKQTAKQTTDKPIINLRTLQKAKSSTQQPLVSQEQPSPRYCA